MSMFQCEHCGCAENTALTSGYSAYAHCWLDFTGIEDRKGKDLCSACTPADHCDGTPVRKGGAWHCKFPRVFLPMGMFETKRDGNLAHKETGETNYQKYAITTRAV